MRRRTFVNAVGTCVALPLGGRVQSASGSPRIGILFGGTVSASVPSGLFEGLRGAKRGDSPVEQVTQFVRVINGKTASALGIAIPHSMRVRAEVIG